MGGGRAPCCDKSKVKRGPWSPAEDMRLITFIQKNGHPNWRSLPKQAGLLRCGKSCRLRWINYLRPDVKRGNFTPEEEETIIKLHYSMGNRWSKIASLLPGRTDNEIKNVWNTHLRKKSAAAERYKINGNAGRSEEGASASPASSSSSASWCSNGEQNTNMLANHSSSDSDTDHQQHQHHQQHSSSSSSSSTSSSEEELMGNSNSSSSNDQDQGHQGEVIDNSIVMYNINMDEVNNQGGGGGEDGGILEIPPSIEEEDINDIWSMLDDLDNEAVVVPPVAALYTPNNVDLEVLLQSSIELGGGGGGDYSKWLRYFENELQLAVLGGGGGGATETTISTTTTAHDDQLEIEPPPSSLTKWSSMFEFD